MRSSNLLEARGLISIEHGRGAVVGGNPRAVRDTLGLLLRVQPKTLWELLEMRKILEVEVAGLAAERAGPDGVRLCGSQLVDGTLSMRPKIRRRRRRVSALLARQTQRGLADHARARGRPAAGESRVSAARPATRCGL